MIPMIENKVTITKELFQEWVKDNQSTYYKKALPIFGGVIGALLLIGVVLFFMKKASPFFLIGEFCFMVGISAWVLIVMPKSRNKSKYKALSQNGTTVPKRTVQFFDDHITVITDAGKTRDFPYDKIVRFRETQNLFILIDHTQTGIMLDKHGFTRGNIEQVKELLPENCVKV